MDVLLASTFLDKPAWLWLSFLTLVIVLLVIDLGLLNRKQEAISVKKSLTLTCFYIVISLIFGVWVWAELGQESALEYYTGYVIEKSLSMDNLFVMAVIFSALKVPRQHQHRVLFWGILGVILLRGIMIGLGAALVHEFKWVLYIFAGFLIFTGIKLFFWEDDEDHEEAVEKNPILQFLRKHFKITDQFHGNKFFVRLVENKNDTTPERASLYMTPLFLALVTIEFADVIFAVDSVPAVFAITTDTFIIYTSNIFAILGLRALFFSLSALMDRFEHLKYAIALVLIFIGCKVFAPLFLPIDKVPAQISLSLTLGILGIGMIYSLYMTKSSKEKS